MPDRHREAHGSEPRQLLVCIERGPSAGRTAAAARDRHVIPARLQEILGRGVSVEHDKAGRPLVVGTDRQLTISRSHGRSATVTLISETSAVGVDIECVRATSVTESLVEVSLSPGERTVLVAVDERHAAEAFFWFWTRKEAVLKAIGIGLAHPPAEVDVAFGTRQQHWTAVDVQGHHRLWVRSFRTVAGEALSLACDQPAAEIVWLGDEAEPASRPSATIHPT